MKVIDSTINQQLRGKVINLKDPNDFSSEDVMIEFTGKTRRIKTIFGKIKEQAEIYVLIKHWDLWNHKTYHLVKKGPYWDSRLM